MGEFLLISMLIPGVLLSLTSLSYQFPADQSTHSAAKATILNSSNDPLMSEIEELKVRVARLESSHEKINQQLDARSLYLAKCERTVENMDDKIHDLQRVLSTLKDVSVGDERLTALEEKVQNLWAASRKNNFDIHILESNAEDVENRLKVVASRVETMANIVTELWIQIQQLEQALQSTERRLIELQRQRRSRCMFFKFVSKISGGQHFNRPYASGKESILSQCISKAATVLKEFLNVMKKYHHQLQGFVKEKMQTCECTAVLANEEVVFFVASALVVFPLLGAWRLLSSQ